MTEINKKPQEVSLKQTERGAEQGEKTRTAEQLKELLDQISDLQVEAGRAAQEAGALRTQIQDIVRQKSNDPYADLLASSLGNQELDAPIPAPEAVNQMIHKAGQADAQFTPADVATLYNHLQALVTYNEYAADQLLNPQRGLPYILNRIKGIGTIDAN